jgi:hypothetical protein
LLRIRGSLRNDSSIASGAAALSQVLSSNKSRAVQDVEGHRARYGPCGGCWLAYEWLRSPQCEGHGPEGRSPVRSADCHFRQRAPLMPLRAASGSRMGGRVLLLLGAPPRSKISANIPLQCAKPVPRYRLHWVPLSYALGSQRHRGKVLWLRVEAPQPSPNAPPLALPSENLFLLGKQF